MGGFANSGGGGKQSQSASPNYPQAGGVTTIPSGGGKSSMSASPNWTPSSGGFYQGGQPSSGKSMYMPAPGGKYAQASAPNAPQVSEIQSPQGTGAAPIIAAAQSQPQQDTPPSFTGNYGNGIDFNGQHFVAGNSLSGNPASGTYGQIASAPGGNLNQFANSLGQMGYLDNTGKWQQGSSQWNADGTPRDQSTVYSGQLQNMNAPATGAPVQAATPAQTPAAMAGIMGQTNNIAPAGTGYTSANAGADIPPPNNQPAPPPDVGSGANIYTQDANGNILVNGKPANGTNASGVTFTSTPAPNPTTGPVSGLTQAQIDALRQQQMANQIQNQGA